LVLLPYCADAATYCCCILPVVIVLALIFCNVAYCVSVVARVLVLKLPVFAGDVAYCVGAVANWRVCEILEGAVAKNMGG
jgi:hypothetical protein